MGPSVIHEGMLRATCHARELRPRSLVDAAPFERPPVQYFTRSAPSPV
jgi:hypothetical protein